MRQRTTETDDEWRKRYLKSQAAFSEALASVPAPYCDCGQYLEWIKGLTSICCWLSVLNRQSEAADICAQWSESVPLTSAQLAENRQLINATIKDAEKIINDDVREDYAAMFAAREPGLLRRLYMITDGEYAPPSTQPRRQQEAQREARQQEFEARQLEQEQATQKQRQKAYADAMRIYGKGNADPEAVRATPYWCEKEEAAGFPLPVPAGVRCGSARMFLPVVGPVWWNSSVIVPLYVINEHVKLGQASIELICGRPNPPASRTGDKRGLKGGLRQGAFFPIGLDRARHGEPLVIVEGLMTGIAASLMMGGKLPVICAMSCEFFSSVIDELQIAYPASPFYIIGDVGTGHRKAADLATERGRAEIYAVDLEPCLPEQEGADAFDMLARHGVDNGMVLLRSMFRTARLARGDATVSPSSSVNP